nr:lysine 2,3-aminomutase [Azotobacter chroococcum]
MQLHDLVLGKKDDARASALVQRIRMHMNPHPAGQLTHNIPYLDGRPLQGLQHKYGQTVLFFPSAGQTCHTYCTFCFRWPQFVGIEKLKFNTREADELVEYVRRHEQVTDILITGGDPMVMNASTLAGYIKPLLNIPHLQNIRIGTKSVASWPQRFVTDKDADDVLRLFERVVASGKSVSIMAHFSHPVEMSTEIARQALRRIISTGANIRMQSPIVRHVNDNASCWSEMWRTGVRLGVVPYYMFVERDTGPYNYFKLPLIQAHSIFKQAYEQVSGLARTMRGPSMSTHPGKVLIDGVAEILGEKVFVLQFLQARNSEWVRKPFFAKFDENACWLDELRPAFGAKKFFYEEDASATLRLEPAPGEETAMKPREYAL